MNALDKALGRAQNVQESGSGWLVSCPLPDHGKGRGDRNPSVSVDVGRDGKILIKCRAGCETEDIVAAWGLRIGDLFERSSHGHDYELARKKSVSIPQKTTATVQPCNLSSYSEAKGLPEEFLKNSDVRIESIRAKRPFVCPTSTKKDRKRQQSASGSRWRSPKR